MTKVYLVKMHKCSANGIIERNGKTLVDEVFTSKKKAIAWVERMNETVWKEQKDWFWTWEQRSICHIDCSKIPY